MANRACEYGVYIICRSVRTYVFIMFCLRMRTRILCTRFSTSVLDDFGIFSVAMWYDHCLRVVDGNRFFVASQLHIFPMWTSRTSCARTPDRKSCVFLLFTESPPNHRIQAEQRVVISMISVFASNERTCARAFE